MNFKSAFFTVAAAAGFAYCYLRFHNGEPLDESGMHGEGLFIEAGLYTFAFSFAGTISALTTLAASTKKSERLQALLIILINSAIFFGLPAWFICSIV